MAGEGHNMPVTQWLAQRASAIQRDDLPADAVKVARQCILDWYAVTIAGASEPAVTLLADELLADGAAPVASLFGIEGRTSALNAALINGTASHALDFDDVNLAILGHPTVALLPGLLALAEQTGATQDEILTAFVAGYEVVCRVGLLTSPSHYNHGFHATSTVGSIGAAAACARLLGLDAERTAIAYGIAATKASGLKSMFGTMCKPLHAGMAAQNGLMAARLAARGYTSRPDALECAQGFAATQSVDFNAEAAMQDRPLDFHLKNNLFKYHASCYLTHGAIEAALAIRDQGSFDPADIRALTIVLPPIIDRVCNIARPSTGLEAKFSLRLTVAMALSGRNTSGIETYTDTLTQEPDLVCLRDLATIEFVEGYPQAKADVVIELRDGRSFKASHDAGLPAADLDRQANKLEQKFDAMVAPLLGARATQLRSALSSFGGSDGVSEIVELARGAA